MSRLPSLGPRGEGWVIAQSVLFWFIAATGALGPSWSGPVRGVTSVAGAILMAAGAVMAVRGVRDLRQAFTPLPRPREGAELVETGVYARVRHPIYGGIIAVAFGWGLLAASPVTVALAVLLAGLFDLKSRREEAWLVVRYPGYAAYRTRTRRLIPWIG